MGEIKDFIFQLFSVINDERALPPSTPTGIHRDDFSRSPMLAHSTLQDRSIKTS